jgi:hypothetical protein
MTLEYTILPVTIPELLGGFRPPPQAPVFFAAYDFNDPVGERFVTDLRSAVAHSQRDAPIQILDGKVTSGKNWASEVRDRISRSKGLLADLTFNSLEVYFECGLAWGLGRNFYPLVSSADRRELLPRWLLGLQVGEYLTPPGFEGVVALLRELADMRIPRARNRCESAVPGKISILTRDNTILENQSIIVKSVCSRYGMSSFDSALLDLTRATVEVPLNIADSSLLIVNIEGNYSDSDRFSAFCVGAILSHPSSGVHTRKLLKRVLVVMPDDSSLSLKIFPDSAKQIKNVKIIHKSALNHELAIFGQAFKDWRVGQFKVQKDLPNAPSRKRRAN